VNAEPEHLSRLWRWLDRERSLGIEAHEFAADHSRIVDGSNSYVLAMLIAARLELPGWWPTRVVSSIERGTFDFGHLKKGRIQAPGIC
jgi:hypothetical protein